VQGLCPFHDDTKSSLTVNLSSGQFKCFGSDKHGSIFDFYMAKHGVDYRAAFNALSKEAGLTTGPVRRWSQPTTTLTNRGPLSFRQSATNLKTSDRDSRKVTADGLGTLRESA